MLTEEQRREIGALARQYDVPAAHLCAVVEIESAGQVFTVINGAKMPMILFEPHIFYRRLKSPRREQAVAAKLASKSWDRKLYPKTQAARYEQLAQASQFGRVEAQESVSYGVGQVLGLHWKGLGFGSVDELVTMALSGLTGQVDLMLRYCRVNNLLDELREGQWAPFARGYNGPNYAVNQYDKKLARYAREFGAADKPAAGMLRMGSTGRRVRELQTLLLRTGAAIKADGDFGPTTKAALIAFQRVNGLKPDGILGPETERALSEQRQSADDRPGKLKLVDIGGVKRGVGMLAAAGVTASQIQDLKGMVEGAAQQITGTGIQSVILDYAVNGLTLTASALAIVGVGLAIRGFFREKETVEA